VAVTIVDVAKLAGVSRSTVSYVLSGARSISPETRQRVEQAIAELQYRPHAGARSIRSGRNGVIAKGVGASSFALTADGVVWWDDAVRRLQKSSF